MPKIQKMSNCNYNILKQLTKTMQFLWNVDQYIDDAKKEGHAECADMWKKIKVDKERHADMLREAVKMLAAEKNI